jgi:hypothetical protein
MTHEHECTDNPYGCGKLTQITEPPVTNRSGKPVEESDTPAAIPKPSVTGNDKVAITKHQLAEIQVYIGMYKVSVEFAIKNISDVTISTLVFEATFYDETGKALETVTQRELDLRPGVSRGVFINSHTITPNTIKSYNVRIVRMTTTETEKVQLRKQDLEIEATGEATVKGLVKNISGVKTDAALIVTFNNKNKEAIGEKVLILRDIDPNTLKQFNLKFKPPAGAIIDGDSIKIISDIAELNEESK